MLNTGVAVVMEQSGYALRVLAKATSSDVIGQPPSQGRWGGGGAVMFIRMKFR